MYCSSHSKTILIAVWTIVQTIFHLTWILLGYYLYLCKIRPSHYDLVFLYLTYFYRNECGDINLKDRDLFSDLIFNYNETEVPEIYYFLKAVLEKGVLPEESDAAYRTKIYFQIFVISDGLWAFSALILLVGACYKIKKCWSILFYGPWLIATACVTLLDVVSAVYYGLDVRHIYSYTSWLKFIGVESYQDFLEYNKLHNSLIIPTIPSIFLCVLFSRLFLIWLSNILCFFFILNKTIVLVQDNINDKNPPAKTNNKQTDRLKCSNTGEELDLNSSEARIRNWQLFYGAIENSSSLSSSSSSDRDCNSNSRTSRDSKNTETRRNDHIRHGQSQASIDSHERYVASLKEISNNSRSVRTTSTYRRYSDVANNIEAPRATQNRNHNSLRSQMPWSYFSPEEIVRNRQHLKHNRHEVIHPAVTIHHLHTASTEL